MYCIGDKIVYPMHGAGIIVAIEEREVFGECSMYYILKMSYDDMRVMIPMHSALSIGIRSVIDVSEADKVIDYFKNYYEEINTNWNKRYRENVERIKSGNIYEVAEVVKMLMLREKDRGLSSGERKMLINAKQILISEFVLAKDSSQDDIESILVEIVEQLVV